MRVQFKPLRDQVIVLTGATSGIGLVTARKAAAKGAKLSIAARNEQALQELTRELSDRGCDLIYTVVDVAREEDLRTLAERTLSHFGGFDTWINNAAVSIYGKVEEVPLEDQRRLFDTNYWGMVQGSRIACEHLRQNGGKLINVGSALSERSIPVQGTYSASKAAVKGFTDALRMELNTDRAPVSVTLIKPGSIDSPYRQHAANYTGKETRNPPPVYAPETVANAILHAAEHNVRESVVGAGGKGITLLGNLAPRLSDKVMSRFLPKLQRIDQPVAGTPKNALYEPGEDMHERGDYPATEETSWYSTAARHKALTATTILGTAAAAYMLSRTRSSNGSTLRKTYGDLTDRLRH